MDRKELVDILRKNVGSPHETILSNIWVHEVIEMLAADGDRILSLQNRVTEGEAEAVELKRRINSLSAELTRTVGNLAKAEQAAIDGDNSETVKNLKKLVHDFQIRVDSTCTRLSEVSAERDRLKKIADTADRWKDLAWNRGGQIGYLLKELDKYKALASGKGNTTVICQKTPPAWDEIEEKLADAVRERDELREALNKEVRARQEAEAGTHSIREELFKVRAEKDEISLKEIRYDFHTIPELRSALAKAYQERDQYMELVSGMKSDHDYLIERVHKLADMVVWYGMELARNGVYSVTEDEDVIAAYNRKYNAHKTDAVLFRREA